MSGLTDTERDALVLDLEAFWHSDDGDFTQGLSHHVQMVEALIADRVAKAAHKSNLAAENLRRAEAAEAEVQRLRGAINALPDVLMEAVFKAAWHEADARKGGPGTKVKAGLRAVRDALLDVPKPEATCFEHGIHAYVTRSHMGDDWPECVWCGIGKPGAPS